MTVKSVFGLNERIVAMLSNLSLGLFGIVAYVIEKENKFVRFHGLQSFITFIGLSLLAWALSVVGGMLGFIPVIGWIVTFAIGILSGLIKLLTVVAWGYLSYTAYKGQMVRVPLVGDVVWEQANK